MKSLRRFAALPIALMLVAAACTDPKSKQGEQQAAAQDAGEARVTAFRELQEILDDSAKLAELLPFPLPDSTFAVYIEDEVFNAKYELAERRLTRNLFLEYYPQISASLQLSEFRELFRKILPRRLGLHDSVYVANRDPKEPCLQFYQVTVHHDTVRFEYGSGHNEAYQTSDDKDTDVCEFATIWEFRLMGSKLHYLRMFQAG